MDEGHTGNVIYLDFVKVIDGVNDRFLVAKMTSFGLDDVIVQWIEVYLIGRASIMHVDGELVEPFQCAVVLRRAP